MKKTLIMLFSIGLLSVTGLKAQSIQDGMNHLYADRYKSALDVFDKMIAAKPDNAEAIYWKGQVLIAMKDIAGARSLYNSALQTTNNAPYVLVGAGQVDLLDKKTNEARQRFETALTASRGRKGNDPQIATAIGRANAAAKNGNYTWAVQLLQEAADSYKKNPPTETLLQLGNAFRKEGQGTGGGKAYEAYKKALEVDPTFAPASVRLADLFQSQKNYELILENLNDAVKRDPKFTAAYYELFYYYFERRKYDEAEVQLKNLISSKAPEVDISDESYYADLCWARKDFDCAIQKDEKVVAQLGDKTNARVYKLLADAYLQKGNFASSKANIDKYFANQDEEKIISFDYQLKADILGKAGAPDDEIYQTYMIGAEVDTVLTSKIEFLKQAAKYFKDLKKFGYEAQVLTKIIELKPKTTINDYFDLMLANYFDGKHTQSRDVALKMIQEFPDQHYGYEWAFNNSQSMVADTTRKMPQDSIAAPDALKLYDFVIKDTVTYKSQYVSTIRYLAGYYINEAKDKQKSLEFFRKWRDNDSANATTIQGYIDQIQKMPDTPPKSPKPKSKPSAVAASGKAEAVLKKVS